MSGQLQAPAERCEYRTKGKRKETDLRRQEIEIIRMGEIRKRYKTRNTVGSKDENEETKRRRGTKEEKEGIRISQRRSQIFSTPDARRRKPDRHCSPPCNATF
jgi:hypothetical protein